MSSGPLSLLCEGCGGGLEIGHCDNRECWTAGFFGVHSVSRCWRRRFWCLESERDFDDVSSLAPVRGEEEVFVP